MLLMWRECQSGQRGRETVRERVSEKENRIIAMGQAVMVWGGSEVGRVIERCVVGQGKVERKEMEGKRARNATF
jgi:hypothetical protein